MSLDVEVINISNYLSMHLSSAYLAVSHSDVVVMLDSRLASLSVNVLGLTDIIKTQCFILPSVIFNCLSERL